MIVKQGRDYWTGTVHTTNRRVWEHDEKFKEYLRRHQMPTQVWYKAYPGLTASDLERNVLVREGFDTAALSGRAADEWVALL
jgi:predicted GIY-YIG superfamily endonuclease